MNMDISVNRAVITPGFSVVHSNHLEDLRDIAVQWISRYPLAPLENEYFLVQSNGMGQWLKMALASDDGCGICAGLSVTLPGSFMWNAYRAVLGSDKIPGNSPYDRKHLVWRLMRLLPRLLLNGSGQSSVNAGSISKKLSSFLPLKRFLAKEDPRKLYQLSCKLASLFDQYQVYRADWLESWSDGKDIFTDSRGKKIRLPDDQIWQAELWRQIRCDLSDDQRDTSRADLHRSFLSTVQQLDSRPAGLPRRVMVFGICSLPGAVIEALHALSRHCQVLLFVQNPCRYYWADIVEENDFSEPESLFSQQVNPLLAAWGKQGRDYIGMLCNFEQSLHEFKQTDLFRNVVPQGTKGILLQQVQQAVLDLKPFPDNPLPDSSFQDEEIFSQSSTHKLSYKIPLSFDDESITFQLCHSPQREMEILQDQLLSFFESIPGLTPRDIIVMTPDIRSYAPHIASVFGNVSHNDPRYIPFTIADKPEQESVPMLLGLEKLLSMPESRMSVGDVMELLQIPAFRQRFALSEPDIQTLARWIQGAGIRWGLNAEQRINLDESLNRDMDIWEQNTWRFGLHRMMLGYAVGTGDAWKEIEPYDEIGGLEASLAGILFSITESLEKHCMELSSKAVPEVWCQRIRELVSDFFLPTESHDHLWMTHLEEVLEKWLQSCNEADFKDELVLAVVRDYVQEGMTESSISHRFLAGMVNFCTLMPMRAIPFRVVCLLGMNDGAYPRSRPPLDFDLMAMQGCYRPGDRSRREDDRYLFLEALLSAREKLYISYTGRSVRDNSQRVPSVLVGQLRDYLESGWQISGVKSCSIKTPGSSAMAAPSVLADSSIVPKRATVSVSAELPDPAQNRSCYEQNSFSVLERLTTQHPLQPFSRSYFEIDTDSVAETQINIDCCSDVNYENRLFTYAHEWRKILDFQEKEQDLENIDSQEYNKPENIINKNNRFLQLKDPQFEGNLQLLSLVRFMKNPVKSFFNQRLRVYFDEVAVAAEELEPFDLDRFALFGPGLQMVDQGINSEPDKSFESVEKTAKQLLRTGQMPVNAFGKIAVRTIADAAETMLESHRKLLLEWPREAESVEISMPISLDGCGIKSLDGFIDRLYRKEQSYFKPDSDPDFEQEPASIKRAGFKDDNTYARWQFYPGKIHDDKKKLTRYDSLVELWVKHLAGCAQKMNLTSYMIATDGVVTIHPLDWSSADRFLNHIVENWWQAMKNPLPVTAKTGMAYLKAVDFKSFHQQECHDFIDSMLAAIPEADLQKAQQAAQRAYEGDGYVSDGELGYCLYLQRVFPDFESLWHFDGNSFVKLAFTLYAPLLQNTGG